jgi:activator of HSP90 ATPase
MKRTIRLTATIPAKPAVVYAAWLDGKQHSAMTGEKATSQARVGGKFTAWDGYISGTHLELKPGKEIVQAWRSTEFPDDAPDSLLEVRFEAAPRGTKLTLIHSEIPDGQAESYAQGWREFYFAPMKKFFAAQKAK